MSRGAGKSGGGIGRLYGLRSYPRGDRADDSRQSEELSASRTVKKLVECLIPVEHGRSSESHCPVGSPMTGSLGGPCPRWSTRLQSLPGRYLPFNPGGLTLNPSISRRPLSPP
jgi:hypothetical protein